MSFRVKLNGWLQTIVLLISIVGSGVGVALWIAGEISDVKISIVKIQSVHDLDMAAVRNRLTAGGWSRPQQQKWIDALRTVASVSHTVPDLE